MRIEFIHMKLAEIYIGELIYPERRLYEFSKVLRNSRTACSNARFATFFISQRFIQHFAEKKYGLHFKLSNYASCYKISFSLLQKFLRNAILTL